MHVSFSSVSLSPFLSLSFHPLRPHGYCWACLQEKVLPLGPHPKDNLIKLILLYIIGAKNNLAPD